MPGYASLKSSGEVRLYLSSPEPVSGVILPTIDHIITLAIICFSTAWQMGTNVEIQWDFDRNIKRYRFESFCYGPKTCKLYRMGRARTVPYRGRPSALDDGWLDDLCTENRDEQE